MLECGGDDGSSGDGSDGDGEENGGANDNAGMNAGGGEGADGGDPGNSEDHNDGAISGTRAQSNAALSETDTEDAHVKFPIIFNRK